MKKILFILLICFGFSSTAQTFVFCPNIEVPRIINIEDSVYIVLEDLRPKQKKLKEKCSKEELIKEVKDLFSEVFKGKSIFKEIDEIGSIKNENRIIFNIQLKNYHTSFRQAKYYAKTIFSLNIIDSSQNQIIAYEEFRGTDSKFNTFGFKSGKIASNNSFRDAFNDMVASMESSVKKTSRPEVANQEDKYDKLKKLKVLLDDGVLTIEEFNKEKKKLLENK